MLYTPLTKKALKLAYAAHAGQVDKAGMPYIFHPYEVALQVQTEEEVCVALLHDVVEDTDWTMEDLRAAGFPETVLEAVQLLTHDPAVPYFSITISSCSIFGLCTGIVWKSDCSGSETGRFAS